jgi:hypothetical protein
MVRVTLQSARAASKDGSLGRNQVCLDGQVQGPVCILLEGNDKQKSLLAVGYCITIAANATWWNWEDGSRPFVTGGRNYP